MSVQPGRRRELALIGVIALIAIAAMALRISAASVGLMSDDLMHHAMLAGIYPGDGYAPFDLYGFLRRGDGLVAHVEQGTAPWWSTPELHGTVLRPLASALLWLDHRLLPGRVVAWHLHSLLWFGASVVALGLVACKLLPRSIALIAVLLFACEAGAATSLAWLANRCVLVCATFGLLAIWTHLEWRRPAETTPAWRCKYGPVIEGVLMALCISAGEYGFAIFAQLLAWELVVGEGRGLAQIKLVLGRLAASLIPIAIYLLAHRLLGYGTFGAETYADPFHAPASYLAQAATRVPQLIAAGFWSVPASTIDVFQFGLLERLDPIDTHATHLRVAWSGIAGAGVLILLARRGLWPGERESLRALVIGALLGLLPIVVAPAHSRLLLIAQLGACTLIASILVASARLVSGRGPTTNNSKVRTRRIRGAALLPFAGLLAYTHTVGELRWGQAYIEHLDQLQARNIAAFSEGDLLDHELGGRDVVILNGPNQSLALHGGFMLDAHGWPAPASWRALALGGQFAMFASRPDPHTLELSAIQGAWMQTAGALFFRRQDQPLEIGDVLTWPTLRVEILAATAGHPTKLRFQFDRPLEQLIFVVATAHGLDRWPVPAVGDTGLVPLPQLPPAADPDSVRFTQVTDSRADP